MKAQVQFEAYIELALRSQDLTLVDLLRFPQLLDGSGEWSAKWWGSGKTTRLRSQNRERILEKVAASRVNELNLKWVRGGDISRTEPLNATHLSCFFAPAQASSLWAPVSDQPLAAREDERQRRYFRSFKDEGSKSPRPSYLECFVNFECENNVDDFKLQTRLTKWLIDYIPEGLRKTQIFGYACVHSTYRKMSMVMSMGGVGPWLDSLGERFENIYPILLGPLRSCEGIASLLGEGSRLELISPDSPSAIVSIPADRIEKVRVDPRVAEWVVSRDLSQVNAPPETLDKIFVRKKQMPHLAPFVRR